MDVSNYSFGLDPSKLTNSSSEGEQIKKSETRSGRRKVKIDSRDKEGSQIAKILQQFQGLIPKEFKKAALGEMKYGVAKKVARLKGMCFSTQKIFCEGPSKSSQAKAPTHFGKSYQVNGQELGREMIYEEAVIDNSIAFLSRMQEEAVNNGDMAQASFYESELKKVQEYQNNQKGWVDSYGVRHLLDGAKSYQEGVKNYISAPVNAHSQELTLSKLKNEKVKVCRLGVISDMTNGWVSLTDLNKMKKDLALLDQKIAELTRKIEAYSDPSKSQSDDDNDEKNPLVSEKQFQSAIHALSQLKTFKGDDPFKPINTPALDRAISERTRTLQMQMIQLVLTQVGRNVEDIKNNLGSRNTFDLLHLALLNEKKSELDKTGWVHDERVEMEDMNEIFKEFQGKSLVFDNKGPLIDGNTIHLPMYDNSPPLGTTLTLNTFFFNISVQGNRVNTAVQHKINNDSLTRLLQSYPDIFKKYPDLVQQMQNLGGPSSYKMAEDFLHSVLRAAMKSAGGLAASLGCLSAKDRTGFVLGRVMQRFLSERIHDLFEIVNPFIKKAISPGSIAKWNIEKNGHKAIKVDPRAYPADFPKTEVIKTVLRQIKAMIPFDFPNINLPKTDDIATIFQKIKGILSF